jgi:hypothetical protein
MPDTLPAQTPRADSPPIAPPCCPCSCCPAPPCSSRLALAALPRLADLSPRLAALLLPCPLAALLLALAALLLPCPALPYSSPALAPPCSCFAALPHCCPCPAPLFLAPLLLASKRAARGQQEGSKRAAREPRADSPPLCRLRGIVRLPDGSGLTGFSGCADRRDSVESAGCADWPILSNMPVARPFNRARKTAKVAQPERKIC